MASASTPNYHIEPTTLRQPDPTSNIGDLWDKVTGQAPPHMASVQLPTQSVIKTWNDYGRHASAAEISDLARQQVAAEFSGRAILSRHNIFDRQSKQSQSYER